VIVAFGIFAGLFRLPLLESREIKLGSAWYNLCQDKAKNRSSITLVGPVA